MEIGLAPEKLTAADTKKVHKTSALIRLAQ